MESRKKFIQYVGITLSSIIMGRCVPRTTCYLPALPPSTPTPTNKLLGDSARDRLRAAWFKFGWLAEQIRVSANSDDMGQEQLELLIHDHQSALDELVADGEIEGPVAEQVQVAFLAAANHVWMSNAPITCYEPVLIDFNITSSNELVMQANVLEQLAQDSELDPNTVQAVRDAIERDIAFLNLAQTDIQALYDQILAEAGENELPSLDEVEFDRSPESIQAAHYLVDLLLGENN